MDEYAKLKKFLMYMVLAFLLLFFAGVVAIAFFCYTPYSFSMGILAEHKLFFWSVMTLPAFVMPIVLGAANLFWPTLSRYSILAVIVSCAYVVAIPRMYKLFGYAEMSVTASVFAFFAVAVCLTVLIRDLKKKQAPRWLNSIFGIIMTLILLVLTVRVSYWILYISFFDRIAVCYAAPIFCLVYMLGSFLDIYTTATSVLGIVCVAYSTLCAAFSIMNQRPFFFVLMGLLVLWCVWQLIDIIKYIFRRKENDSKSCNA